MRGWRWSSGSVVLQDACAILGDRSMFEAVGDDAGEEERPSGAGVAVSRLCGMAASVSRPGSIG